MREIKFRVWFDESGIPPQMIYTHLDDFIRNADGYVLGILVLDTYFKKGMEICYDVVNGKENWLKEELGEMSDVRYNANNSKLMQYTGLKDKNGKEIYEGDILKVARWHTKDIQTSLHSIKVELVEDEAEIGNVFWSDISCQWTISFDHIRYDDHNAMRGGISHRYEIIGNIFEHPELLTRI